MDIDVPFRELGAVPSDTLREVILALPQQAWEESRQCQQDYELHRCTESIVMIFSDGSGWPDITVSREAGWDLLADLAVPMMEGIIRRHYQPGGAIIRAMAARLLPGEVITPHRDSHPSFHHGHRIHVPIQSNPQVRFTIDGRPYNMKVGEAYEINNQKTHGVINKGNEERINFIFDYVPPELLGSSVVVSGEYALG